jgi:hypothetical protein
MTLPPTIYPIGDNPTIQYAALELQKYLQRMLERSVPIQTEMAFDPPAQSALWLGTGQDFPQIQLPTLASDLDDLVYIDVENGYGIIAGANPRSVLLAVYRFLTAVGCRWVRPRPDGEYLPHRMLEDLSAHLQEKPSYRHRAICIEGAVSLENVLDIVEWAPKVGFSGYFHQFREGHTFFDRWYSRWFNPSKPKEKISVEQARQFTRKIEDELERRGMVYHAVGHGWTTEAYGIPGLGWDPVVQEWPEEVVNVLALVNGKRAMWWDIPLITSLCFSNPQVRRKIVDCVVDYLGEHPNIQALHLWLDDGFNNKCECENCTKLLPADFYVILLNDLAERLDQIGYTNKIVFLAYADMLWPPEIERIKHNDRFIFMFAPITRSYRKPLAPENKEYPLPPFLRNKLIFSDNNDEQLAFLRGWQKIFQGDSFIFEYHLVQGGVYTNDPDHLFMARLLHQDIQNLRSLGLDGMVSCQFLRVFFPTGLPMYVMGKTLWDETVTFEAIASDYFASAFGADGAVCCDYLSELGKLQDIVPLRRKDIPVDPAAAEKIAQAREIMVRFAPVIQRNLQAENTCHAQSWRYLQLHAEIMHCYLDVLSARAAGDQAAVLQRWEEMKETARRLEDDLQPVFDLYALISTYEEVFTGKRAIP